MATALHAAVEAGNLEEVRRLLKEDGAADLVFSQDPGTLATPLDLAAMLSHVEIATVLLQAVADVAKVLWRRYFAVFSALQTAAAFGHLGALELLLAHSPDPNAAKVRALTSALAFGQVQCARYLITSGADVNTVPNNSRGRHPLVSALRILEEEDREIFLEQHPKLSASLPVKTPEVILELFKMLIEAGSVVVAGDGSEETPFRLSAVLGSKEIFRLLLDTMAHPDGPTEENLSGILNSHMASVLSVAAGYGHASIIELILEVTGPLPPSEVGSFPPLESAANKGHLKALKILLALNPVPTTAKSRALHHALQHGHVECARLLISSGADVNTIYRLGYYSHAQHPLERAFTGIAKWRADWCLDLNVQENANKVTLELVTMLVEGGSDVNSKCSTCNLYRKHTEDYEMSILCYASLNGQWPVVEYLLANGADITAKDDQGWGALHYAVASGSPETVEYLLSAVAAEQVQWKISTLVEEGHDRAARNWTALDILGMCDWRILHFRGQQMMSEYAKIVQLLVDNGADLEAKNYLGNTPLHSACRIGDVTTPAGCEISANRCVLDGEDVEDDEAAIYTAAIKSLPLISALLQAGANPNALNNLGQTPLHVLLAGVMSEIQQLSNDFLRCDYYCWESIYADPMIRDWLASFCSTVRVLVEAGADLNHRDRKGKRPLHAFLQSVIKIYRKRDDQERDNRDYGQLRRIIAVLVDPITVELVRGGARSWGSVPTPCLGIEKALFSVWKHGGSTELRYLIDRLDSGEKTRILPRLQTCLLLFNLRLP